MAEHTNMLTTSQHMLVEMLLPRLADYMTRLHQARREAETAAETLADADSICAALVRDLIRLRDEARGETHGR